MTYVADHVVCACMPVPAPRRRSRPTPPRVRCRDARWPAVAAALAALRATKRRSVRIVDADCGAGRMLLCAVRYARALGFTAIEARGIDDAPAMVGRARAAAAVVNDPAIGITFEAGEVVGALGNEYDFPADIVMWHGRETYSDAIARAVAAAGRTLIVDPVAAARAAA